MGGVWCEGREEEIGVCWRGRGRRRLRLKATRRGKDRLELWPAASEEEEEVEVKDWGNEEVKGVAVMVAWERQVGVCSRDVLRGIIKVKCSLTVAKIKREKVITRKTRRKKMQVL